jgi:AraC-like DNA-binding protein
MDAFADRLIFSEGLSRLACGAGTIAPEPSMMPAIPLPFVVALLLVILIAGMARRGEDRRSIAFIAMCAVLVTMVGLRWSFDLKLVRFLQPVMAATFPPAAWVCFAGLARRDQKPLWPHAVPGVIVAILSATSGLWHPPIDAALALIFFGYGAALLRLAWAGPDALDAARFSDAAGANRAVMIAGLALIASGSTDLLIAADFGLYQGSHAAMIVTIASLATLLVTAYAVALAGQSRPVPTSEDTPESDPENLRTAEPADTEIVAAVDRLMRERALYRDPNLTLERLARRAVIPARQISAAINRVHGRNVSQVVNEFRITEAKRLLAETSQPVTAIMFDCGFQTKSNFNREFRRVTGVSPSDFRRSVTQEGSGDAITGVAEALPPESR